MEHFVSFEDVSKYYQTGSVKITAADKMSFYVDKGEFCTTDPGCFVVAKIGGFSLPAKLSDNYFSKVTLVHPILPPKGGFILDIFIRA